MGIGSPIEDQSSPRFWFISETDLAQKRLLQYQSLYKKFNFGFNPEGPPLGGVGCAFCVGFGL